MRNDQPIVTIYDPQGRELPMRRRRGGSFRPYGAGDGTPAPAARQAEPEPAADRRRKRRGPGDMPPGSLINLDG